MEIIKFSGLGGETRDYLSLPKAVPPQRDSDYIVGVSRDGATYHCGDGDMWPLTWAGDGSMYGAAGDNRGSAMNFWRVSQRSDIDFSVPKLTHTGDWTLDLVHPRPVPDDFPLSDSRARCVKPAGLIELSGTLYLSVEAQDYGESCDPLFRRQTNFCGFIITSRDGGASWKLDATPTDFFTGRLSSCHFVNHGRGDANAPGGIVYAVFPCGSSNPSRRGNPGGTGVPCGGEAPCGAGAPGGGEAVRSYWENADGLLLGRVVAGRLLEREAWEFWDGETWTGDDSRAAYVFSYPNLTGSDHITWNAGIGRYILGNYAFVDDELRPRPIHQLHWPEGYRSQLTLFESPSLTGPWKLFFRDDDWARFGGYQPIFPCKWMSADGRTMAMVYAGSFDDYNFCVKKYALRLAADAALPESVKYFDFLRAARR